MNNWIQNIKGQLTELATEVLHEATEEGQVSTTTELQVEKNKSTESERLYLVERAKREALEKKLRELEDQLYSTNIENDAIKEKFMGMVSDRDQRIAQLNKLVEGLKFHKHDDLKEFRSIDLDDSTPKSTNAETNIELAKLKEKHEHEISAIMSVNASNVQQIREDYEHRIRELESWNILDAKDSSSSDDVVKKSKNDDKATELAKLHSELGKKDQQISELQVRLYELQASMARLNEIEMEKKEKEAKAEAHAADEIRRLKTLNAELMSAYNEVNSQLEELKKNRSPSETVTDLSAKIASLKSMLNETESRYELCKMDQNETASRLEQLLKEFADLKSSMQAARASAEGTEQELMTEIYSLRDTLGREKDDREKLIADFRGSMKEIDTELSQLRECNRRLVQENSELGTSLAQFETLRNSLNSGNQELSSFRENFATMQSEYREEIQELKTERDELREKLEEFLMRTQETPEGEKSEIDILLPPVDDKLNRQLEELRAELKEKEEEVQKLRSEKLLIASIHQTDQFKRPSSDTDSAASNNDWERMGKDDIEVEGVSSNTSETKEPHTNEAAVQSGVKEESHDVSTQSDEDAQLQNKITNLEGTIHQMDKRIQQLEDELTSELEMRTKLEEENGKLEQTLASNEIELTNFREQICNLEDELIKQKASLQDEFQNKLANTMETEQTLQLRLTDASGRNDQLKSEFEKLLAEYTDLRDKLHAETELAETEQIKASEKQLGELVEMNRTLETACKELEHKLAEKESIKSEQDQENLDLLTHLKAENENYKAMIETKHAECQDYYSKLQELASHCQQMENQTKAAEEKLMLREQEVAHKSERVNKLENELTRLRDHLLTMEEISSKEAFAAEERETDLRRQIRQLQEKFTCDESSLSQNMERYQSEIMELKTRIASQENECIDLRSMLEEREISLNETTSALTNMQIVLKELAEDQQKEKQQFERELRDASGELNRKSETIMDLHQKQTELIGQWDEYKIQFDALQAHLLEKETLIEELENQLEDVRTNTREDKFSGPGGSHGSNISFKIDDQTLRQLFLSFFTAEKAKQPDIAIVMSKILGYNAEEQSHIQKALSSSSTSWFGFGGGDSPRAELSLTEQFVRFLEQESTAQHRAQPMLATSSQGGRTGDFLIGESMTPPTQHSSSANDLKSIIDS